MNQLVWFIQLILGSLQKSREGCILFGHLPTHILTLTLNITLNTHLVAAAHKISSRHVTTMTMNAYESVGLVHSAPIGSLPKSREGCILFGHLSTHTLMLTINVTSNTHLVAAAHKISFRHVKKHDNECL